MKKTYLKSSVFILFIILSGTIMSFSLRGLEAEKEFQKATVLASSHRYLEAQRFYKKAAKLAPWERRYTTYIGINYEIIADFAFNSKKTRLELLKKTETAYLKSLEQTKDDIWPVSGLVRAYQKMSDLEPQKKLYKEKIKQFTLKAQKLCPSRKFY